MQRRRPPRKQRKKEVKKTDGEDDLENVQTNTYEEDDKFYQKWAGPVLLGPFLPALFALFIIVSGQLVLATYTGTCGYNLGCK